MKAFNPSESQLRDYVQDNLDDEDTENLELWLLDHPDVLEDLEMDVMLIQADFNPVMVSTEKKLSQWQWILKTVQNNKLIPIHVFAYGLALMFLTNSFFQVRNDSSQSEATFVELEKQRGVGANILRINVPNKNLVIRLFPDSMQNEYQLNMSAKSSKKKVEFKKLKADELGSITVTLQNIEVGEWQIALIDKTNKMEQEFKIDVN